MRNNNCRHNLRFFFRFAFNHGGKVKYLMFNNFHNLHIYPMDGQCKSCLLRVNSAFISFPYFHVAIDGWIIRCRHPLTRKSINLGYALNLPHNG